MSGLTWTASLVLVRGRSRFRRIRGAAPALLIATLAAPRAIADDAEPSVRLERTELVCEPLGMGAIETVPFNFPGVPESDLEALRARLPGMVETALPPGGNPNVPRVFGGDLGAPFEHADGRLHFIFDDVELAPDVGIAPEVCDPNGVCGPRIVNNDLVATSSQVSPPTPNSCLSLSIESVPGDPTQFRPLTYNGTYNQGGANLGGGVVPGPGFSTGKYIFTLMPRGQNAICTLRESDNTCPQDGGIEGDVCAPIFGPTLGLCYFGECSPSADSPCALRFPPSTLAVQREGSDYVTPEVGVQIESARVLDAYRGHFATASFYSDVDFRTGNGRVWVVGRDGFWGTQAMKMDPYLLFHPVRQGRLGEARYFAGLSYGRPVFSTDRTQAQPIFREDKLVHNHTSIAYLPQLDGGTWVMLYGGRAQVAIRDAIGFFVRPVTDDHFYDPNAGVYLRWSKTPWGPWSDAITIFNAMTQGQGGYCDGMYFEDPDARMNFACPPDKLVHNAHLDRRVVSTGLGAEYGVAILSRYAQNAELGRTFDLYWLMSTWNPYRVVVMRSRFAIDPDTSSRHY
jgi:hypothetical protein